MLDKSAIGERIKALRQELKLNQEEFAAPLEIKRASLSQIETGTIAPSLELLYKIVGKFNTSYNWLINGEGGQVDVNLNVNPIVNPKLKKKEISEYAVQEDRAPYYKPNVLPIVVDQHNDEKIVLVPVSARAGYLTGFGDPEFIRELPHFSLVGYSGGTYRAFEVEGDSMEPTLLPKDIIVCQYIENPTWVLNGEIYVVHTDTGLVVKRCFYDKRSNKLEMVSDNDYISSYKLHAADVRELWRFRCVIRVSLGHSKGNIDARLAKLESMVNMLQAELNNKQ